MPVCERGVDHGDPVLRRNVVGDCAGLAIFAPVKCEESASAAEVPRPRNGESTVDMAVRLGKLRRVVGLRMADVEIARCIEPEPDSEWMKQIGRNLTDASDGFLLGKRYLIFDRDSVFTKDFRTILKAAGVKPVVLPPRSPNLNAYAERFVRSIKEGCLNGIIFFGEQSLRRAITEFMTHYHKKRNHQGLENRLIDPEEGVGQVVGQIERRARLGGMLKYYYREAA